MQTGRDIRAFFRPALERARANGAPTGDDSARQALCDKVKASALEPKPKPINTAAVSVRPPPPPSTALSRQSPPVPNSQSSINSAASKKAVQHGKSVVLNSDSESDLEGYELDWGIPSTKMPVETRAQALANSPPSKSSLYLQQNRANRWKPPVTTNSSKAALSKLVEQAKRDAETDRQVAEWKAMLEKPLETAVDAHAAIHQDLLANIVGDDEEEGRSKRLLLAMQRTNATDTDGGFHFLKKVAKQPSRRSPSFPTSSLPNSGLRACFKDPLFVEQAFVTGFAQTIFKHKALPEEISRWVIDEVCSGRRNGLTPKYLGFLENHSRHLATILNKRKINELFLIMGADLDILDQEAPLSHDLPQDTPETTPPQLLPVLLLLQSAAKWLQRDTLKHTLLILFHLCFDNTVISDRRIRECVQDTIEILMHHVPDTLGPNPILGEIVETLTSHIQQPTLQKPLISALPSQSPITVDFRRHLAMAFLMRPKPLPANLSTAKNLPALFHLTVKRSKHLQINRETNYASLCAAVSMLDLAIGPGPDHVPRPPPPSCGSQADSPKHSLSKAEIDFNKEVDVLVQHLRLVGNGIIEGGALSDPSRMEAKTKLETICSRLEHGVRFGGRKRMRIFDDEEDEFKTSKRIFGKWMGRERASRTATPVDDSEKRKDENQGVQGKENAAISDTSTPGDAVVEKDGGVANSAASAGNSGAG